MTSYQIAIVDPAFGDVGPPIFHHHVIDFPAEHTIHDVFIYLTSSLFLEVLPGSTPEAIMSRGLKYVRFFGIEIYGRQQRKLDVRNFDVAWNEFCSGFQPLIDVTFYLQPKPVVERLAIEPNGALYNIFLSPLDKKMAIQSQESSQRGTYLPLTYSEWRIHAPGKMSFRPYVEKQWDSTNDFNTNLRVVFYRRKKKRKIRDFEIRDFFSHSKKLETEILREYEALRISYFSHLRDLVFEFSYFSYFSF